VGSVEAAPFPVSRPLRSGIQQEGGCCMTFDGYKCAILRSKDDLETQNLLNKAVKDHDISHLELADLDCILPIIRDHYREDEF
jgi:hypothetical protein